MEVQDTMFYQLRLSTNSDKVLKHIRRKSMMLSSGAILFLVAVGNSNLIFH